MNKISFVNNNFLPHDQAFIHIEDRGFQFGDGIYEVILFNNNKLIDFDWHLVRLQASAKAIDLKFNKSADQIKAIILELFSKNNLNSGYVYLQITRGSAPRNQVFPDNCQATIVATVSPLKNTCNKTSEEGISAITHPDLRWQRCDVKSICLLAGTLAKQKAKEANADEAILIKDDYVTEGSFSNIFIVDNNGCLITRNADSNILCGITRNRIIELSKANNIKVIEEKFPKAALFTAKEVFASSSTLKIRPINKIDNKIIGDGKNGQITKKLMSLYDDFIK